MKKENPKLGTLILDHSPTQSAYVLPGFHDLGHPAPEQAHRTRPLQERHQDLERRDADQHEERQDTDGHEGHRVAGEQFLGEHGERDEQDVAGEHVGRETNGE